jgi:flagellar assembly factor FliW
MEILTRDYGAINVDESSVIRFDDGILGFEERRDFVLLDGVGEESPFKCLQSAEESGLAFVMLDPFIVKPDYEISLGDDLIDSLGIQSADDVAILAIVVVSENIEKMSFNLKAPVVINTRLRKAAQYVVDSDKYKVRHYIIDELNSHKAPAAELPADRIGDAARQRQDCGSSGFFDSTKTI